MSPRIRGLELQEILGGGRDLTGLAAATPFDAHSSQAAVMRECGARLAYRLASRRHSFAARESASDPGMSVERGRLELQQLPPRDEHGFEVQVLFGDFHARAEP